MISENDTVRYLERFQEKGDALNQYQATELIPKPFWESKRKGLDYLLRVGFIEQSFKYGGLYYVISKKGFDLIKKGLRTVKVEEDVKVVGKDKRRVELLKQVNKNPGVTVKELLDDNESIGTLHHILDGLCEDKLIRKVKDGKRNTYYPEIEGTYKLNKEESLDFSIGQIIDMLWGKGDNLKIQPKGNLKNMEHDAVIITFKHHDPLIKTYTELPEPIRKLTIPTIDRKHKRIQLNIPIPG